MTEELMKLSLVELRELLVREEPRLRDELLHFAKDLPMYLPGSEREYALKDYAAERTQISLLSVADLWEPTALVMLLDVMRHLRKKANKREDVELAELVVELLDHVQKHSEALVAYQLRSRGKLLP